MRLLTLILHRGRISWGGEAETPFLIIHPASSP